MTATDKIITRIKALINRAVHPTTPVEESRTAAVMAVKLIVDANVHLLTEEPAAAPIKPTSSKPPSPRNVPNRPSKTAMPKGVRVIKAVFPQHCRSCNGYLAAGSETYWARGQGITHISCGAWWKSKFGDAVPEQD